MIPRYAGMGRDERESTGEQPLPIAWLAKQVDRLLPPTLLESREDRFRGRVLVSSSLFLTVVALAILVVRALTVENQVGILSTVVAVLLCLLLPIAVRLSGSYR